MRRITLFSVLYLRNCPRIFTSAKSTALCGSCPASFAISSLPGRDKRIFTPNFSRFCVQFFHTTSSALFANFFRNVINKFFNLSRNITPVRFAQFKVCSGNFVIQRFAHVVPFFGFDYVSIITKNLCFVKLYFIRESVIIISSRSFREIKWEIPLARRMKNDSDNLRSRIRIAQFLKSQLIQEINHTNWPGTSCTNSDFWAENDIWLYWPIYWHCSPESGQDDWWIEICRCERWRSNQVRLPRLEANFKNWSQKILIIMVSRRFSEKIWVFESKKPSQTEALFFMGIGES